jgi:hypothetical protein
MSALAIMCSLMAIIDGRPFGATKTTIGDSVYI